MVFQNRHSASIVPLQKPSDSSWEQQFQQLKTLADSGTALLSATNELPADVYFIRGNATRRSFEELSRAAVKLFATMKECVLCRVSARVAAHCVVVQIARR